MKTNRSDELTPKIRAFMSNIKYDGKICLSNNNKCTVQQGLFLPPSSRFFLDAVRYKRQMKFRMLSSPHLVVCIDKVRENSLDALQFTEISVIDTRDFVQMTHDMIPDEIIGGLLQPVDEFIENITSSVKAR
jgi:hypothetical protein